MNLCQYENVSCICGCVLFDRNCTVYFIIMVSVWEGGKYRVTIDRKIFSHQKLLGIEQDGFKRSLVHDLCQILPACSKSGPDKMINQFCETNVLHRKFMVYLYNLWCFTYN